ncbi:MAG: hypothetical protein WC651_00590 [Candidatus Gracilibacteria bacterium]|jgi:hypothetical protein
METIIVILLVVIAYILWRIYRQKEDDNQAIADQKFDAEWEAKKKEEFKDFPNLIGKVDYAWLEIFGRQYVEIEKNHPGRWQHGGSPHLNAAFMMYLKESNNTDRDIIEVDHLFDSLWDLTEELFEHLEKYHEGTKWEHEIAIITFWQLAETESFKGKDFEAIKKMFQSAPFTDIEKITSWFPKKDNHPEKELSFRDKKGNFPRESKGSKMIHDRITV